MGVILLSEMFLVAVVHGRRGRLGENERRAVEGLKRLAEAEADFAGNDRDGNRTIDYWTGDVAGLRRWIDPQEFAEADAGYPDARPLHGYLFGGMTLDGMGRPYREETTGSPGAPRQKNHLAFGFCAYPSAYLRSGRSTFLINERNRVYELDTGGRPVLAWPADPTSTGRRTHD